jgi:hypothetical protein
LIDERFGLQQNIVCRYPFLLLEFGFVSSKFGGIGTTNQDCIGDHEWRLCIESGDRLAGRGRSGRPRKVFEETGRVRKGKAL